MKKREQEFKPFDENLLERPLPNSPDAEKAVLGAILLDNGLMSEASDLLSVEDFYVPSHRRIFTAMLSLYLLGSDINSILIGEELRRDSALESVGGISFITNLYYGLPHFTNIKHYAKIIRGKAALRGIVKEANKICAEALDETIAQDSEEAEMVAERGAAALLSIAEKRLGTEIELIGPTVDRVLERGKQNIGHAVMVSGLATGLRDVDEIMGGMAPQNLIIIAARPAMGKTSLGLCIAENVAVLKENVVVIFSMEMSREEVCLRMLCSRARVDSKRFKLGMLSDEEVDRLDNAAGELFLARIIIFEDPAMSCISMRSRCERVRSIYKRLDLTIADYLQLMSTNDGKKVENRQQEVSAVARELKGLAKSLNVPVIAMSQLSRKCEERPNKRPVLSDLRDSGEIEQAADLVEFIYGEWYYEEQENKPVTSPNVSEIITAKSRSGATGIANVRFERRITRFEDLAQNATY